MSERQVLSDESKQVAPAIRIVANPGRKVSQSHERSLRIVVWIVATLVCALVWATVAYLAAGGSPPW
jgi:hypothetical protein